MAWFLLPRNAHTAYDRIAKEELSAKPKVPDAWHSKEQSPGVDVSHVCNYSITHDRKLDKTKTHQKWIHTYGLLCWGRFENIDMRNVDFQHVHEHFGV